MVNQQILWVEKYRPKTLDDVILTEKLSETFKSYILDGKLSSNMLFVGNSGVGKTTVAVALAKELGLEYIMINGSLNGNIDTLRVEIQQFASSVSFLPGRKLVILDEADYLNPNSTQPALRNFMEEYAGNCSFILTANYQNKIIKPLISRLSTYNFSLTNGERAKVALKMFQRLEFILQKENVKYDKNLLKTVVKEYFPDLRKMINEVQAFSISGNLDPSILLHQKDDYDEVMTFIKQKNFSEMRKWVGKTEIKSDSFFKFMYNSADKYFKSQSIPQLILILAKYQYQDAFVADKEINIVACITQIMIDCIMVD